MDFRNLLHREEYVHIQVSYATQIIQVLDIHKHNVHIKKFLIPTSDIYTQSFTPHKKNIQAQLVEPHFKG